MPDTNLIRGADAISRNNITFLLFGSAGAHLPGRPQPVGSAETRLGLSQMDEVVETSLPEEFQYPHDQSTGPGGGYSNFCREHSLAPFPLNEHKLFLFSASLSQSVSVGAVLSYLCFYQISLGLPDPCLQTLPRLTYVRKGIGQVEPIHSCKRRLPITPAILRVVKSLHFRQQDVVGGMLYGFLALCVLESLLTTEQLPQIT